MLSKSRDIINISVGFGSYLLTVPVSLTANLVINNKNVADSLNVTGFAENDKGGSVKVVCEGEWEAIERLVNAIKQNSPSFVRIEEVKAAYEQYKSNGGEAWYYDGKSWTKYNLEGLTMALVLETDRESGRNPNDPNYFALAMWQAMRREIITINQSGNHHDKIENFISVHI
jgi:acylphosphatase